MVCAFIIPVTVDKFASAFASFPVELGLLDFCLDELLLPYILLSELGILGS